MNKLVFVASVFLAAAGCTSSPPGDVNGNMIHGVAFQVVDGAAMVRTSRGLTNIFLTDFANTCSIADESLRPSSKQLGFMVTNDTSAGSAAGVPVAPGTYVVTPLASLPPSGPAAECGFAVLDATCQSTAVSANCDSGTITLTRVDAQGYAGTFDVVIAGAHVTGSFDVPSCSNGNSESGFGTCQ